MKSEGNDCYLTTVNNNLQISEGEIITAGKLSSSSEEKQRDFCRMLGTFWTVLKVQLEFVYPFTKQR